VGGSRLRRKEDSMPDFRDQLDEITEEYLNGRVSFDEFQRAHSKCYIDDQADADFTSEEIDHYGAVHEKAERTSPTPTLEDR
jgi:hypothetical protein